MTDVIIRGEDQRAYAIKLIMELDLQKPWKVVITKFVKHRSASQMGLYWMWMHEISNETGNDAEDLHEFFKQKFIPPRVVTFKGEESYVFTTKGLNTQEMNLYLDKILAFAGSELGIYLTLPEEGHITK